MLNIPSVKINNIETKIYIAMVPDDYDYASYETEPPNEPFGVRVIVEIHNWTTGNNLKLQTAGLWGLDCDTPMTEIVEIAQDELNELKVEFPDICKDLIVDNATPARFI